MFAPRWRCRAGLPACANVADPQPPISAQPLISDVMTSSNDHRRLSSLGVCLILPQCARLLPLDRFGRLARDVIDPHGCRSSPRSSDEGTGYGVRANRCCLHRVECPRRQSPLPQCSKIDCDPIMDFAQTFVRLFPILQAFIGHSKAEPDVLERSLLGQGRECDGAASQVHSSPNT